MHELEPRDMSGKVLRAVPCVAARRYDQLVLIDANRQKVVVTDFDGECKGIYDPPQIEDNLLSHSS